NGFVGQSGTVASGRPSFTTFGVSTGYITSSLSSSFTVQSSTSSLCSDDRGSGFIVNVGKNVVVGIAKTTPGSCNATNVAWDAVHVAPYANWIRSAAGLPT